MSNHKLKDKKLLEGNESLKDFMDQNTWKHHKPNKCSKCSSEGNSRGIKPHLNLLTTVSNSREETGCRWRAAPKRKSDLKTWKTFSCMYERRLIKSLQVISSLFSYFRLFCLQAGCFILSFISPHYRQKQEEASQRGLYKAGSLAVGSH